MANTDHAGFKKVQVWIPESLWDEIESLNFPNTTSAVTAAFKALLEISQNNPKEPQEIPRLEATIEGLQMLLQEKDERISDLKREAETLGVFAHYFRSLEHRRIETSAEDREVRVQGREEERTKETREANEEIRAARERGQQEHRDKPTKKPVESSLKEDRLMVQEQGEKQTSRPGKAQRVKDVRVLMKTCKNCNQEFETSTPTKETCSDKCRTAYSRKNRKLQKEQETIVPLEEWPELIVPLEEDPQKIEPSNSKTQEMT